ncbi:MAG: hypothetical protein ACHBNF_05725, partial [Chromatiales bacterium]
WPESDTVLTNRPNIYVQSSLQAIINPHLANRVESIYTISSSERVDRGPKFNIGTTKSSVEGDRMEQ